MVPRAKHALTSKKIFPWPLTWTDRPPPYPLIDFDKGVRINLNCVRIGVGSDSRCSCCNGIAWRKVAGAIVPDGKRFTSAFEKESNFGYCGIILTWSSTDLELKDRIVNRNLVASTLEIVVRKIPSNIMRIFSSTRSLGRRQGERNNDDEIWLYKIKAPPKLWTSSSNAPPQYSARKFYSFGDVGPVIIIGREIIRNVVYIPGLHPLVCVQFSLHGCGSS
jgi:hypothetical protein